MRRRALLAGAGLCLAGRTPFVVAQDRETPPADEPLFRELMERPWRQAFRDAGDGDWRERWSLDGLKATVVNTARGMEFQAGPVRREDASHAVLWTKQSFAGDIRLDYEYTKLDEVIEAVTILYIQATGSGSPGFAEDIAAWRDKRAIPAMRLYFQNMNTLHISYAAFRVGNTTPGEDYIRARRYQPNGEGLSGTDFPPDHERTGLFAPHAPHQITVIKTNQNLFMAIRNERQTRLCHWRIGDAPPVLEGRVGMRHMWTRAARYRNVTVSTLPSGE